MDYFGGLMCVKRTEKMLGGKTTELKIRLEVFQTINYCTSWWKHIYIDSILISPLV